MSTSIIMRHGRRKTGADAPLVCYNSTDPDNSAPEVWQSVHQIIEARHPVRQIITSPYLRTRQTSALVQYSYLKLTGNYLPIHVDVRLGEYSHRHCRLFTPSDSDFDPETSLHYRGHVPLCRESPGAFVQRVAQFYTQLPPDAIIVTHYGVAELLGIFSQRVIKLPEGGFSILVPLTQATETQLINSPTT